MPQDPPTAQIKASEIKNLMAQDAPATIAKYFYLDTTHPFSPLMRPKPGVTIESDPGEIQELVRESVGFNEIEANEHISQEDCDSTRPASDLGKLFLFEC